MQSGIVPYAGQIAIASTVFFTSFSSTLLLQVVAHPYVATLYEVTNNKDIINPLQQTSIETSGSSSSTSLGMLAFFTL